MRLGSVEVVERDDHSGAVFEELVHGFTSLFGPSALTNRGSIPRESARHDKRVRRSGIDPAIKRHAPPNSGHPGAVQVHPLLVHGAALAVGAVAAWAVVGEAWVRFDSIVPMWIATAGCLAVAAAVVSRWRAWGLALGLAASAVLCGFVFTVLSSGPSFD